MVRTIRIKTEEYYKELLKIEGELQTKTGKTQTMDGVIGELLKKAGRNIKIKNYP